MSSPLSWRIEGPFDTSYSLAILNRELAKALDQRGQDVALFATEGPGDYAPDPQFLKDNPDLARLWQHSSALSAEKALITSRNLFPPRVADLSSRLNTLHAYGWEESGFPSTWVHQFNAQLQGITVMSEHVRKVLIDNGVAIPLETCGLGTEHLLAVEAEPFELPHLRSYCFLHVSSCFPRKGVKELLEAYRLAFTGNDEVTLIIKTFPNPHHSISSLVDDFRNSCEQPPHVVVLQDDLTSSQLRYLYSKCHALVAPSKAEGFGLPLAEAMRFGLPVICTAWGGQLDFCTQETAFLVDYAFEWAESHFEQWCSVWAKPDVAHLAAVMMRVYRSSQSDLAAKISAAQHLLHHSFSWPRTAERLEGAALKFLSDSSMPVPRFGWVTTWNVPCGISSYSKHLIDSIDPDLPIFANHVATTLQTDQSSVSRCWTAGVDNLDDLLHSIERSNLNGVVIQFNYGFFVFSRFLSLLLELRRRNLCIIVVLHSTQDPVDQPDRRLSLLLPGLRCCDRLLVHSPDDLNRLKALGLVNNVALFPHGLPSSPSAPRFHRRLLSRARRHLFHRYHLASYGFCLPHKGLIELVKAIHIMRQSGISVHLDLFNSEYPNLQSAALAAEIATLIQSLDLSRHVVLHQSYSSDLESLANLAAVDLIVFPYQQTQESSSAAVRHGLSAGPPVCTTPLAIFGDVARVTHRLDGTSVDQIATGLTRLLQQLRHPDDTFSEIQRNAQVWRVQHQFPLIGRRLYGIMQALLYQLGSNHLA